MARKKLKLYVWTEVLLDWGYGIAFAYASSPEEAKEVLIQDGVDEWHWNGLLLDGQEHFEVKEPSGFHVWGSA
jgi:hypothetical protein